MLLPEQSLLLVLGETGEAVLVAAKPERHEELARTLLTAGLPGS